jgi:ATP-dependent exoDNAse (exonuclease V) beta subunit
MMEPQERAARSRALRDAASSLLIEAAAGSGKTTLMAGRIVRALADGVAPGAIAAITFTEAAAAHLRNKVAAFVAAVLAGRIPPEIDAAFPEISAAERVALEGAWANLDDLACSTIHAFARSLTAPFPVETGLAPDAAVLDPAAASELLSDVRDAWWRDLADASTSVVAGFLRVDSEAMALVDDLLALLRREPDAFAAPPADADAAAAFLAAVEAFAGEVEGHAFTPPEAAAVVAAVRALAGGAAFEADPLAAALVLTADEGAAALLWRKDGGWLSASRLLPAKPWEGAAAAHGATKVAGRRAAEAAQQALDVVTAAYERLTVSVADALLAALVDELRQVLQRYQTRKHALGVVDTDDLLRDAVALLRRDRSVRDLLAERFAFVLIDEFQDTDPLQAEIVWRLTSDGASDDWATSRSRPGARFVVGDPRQAIYRFRNADVATYETLKARVADDPHAAVLRVATNFRSLPDVLAFTNATFAPHFAAVEGGLVAHRDGSAAAVFALPVPSPDDGGSETTAAWREAEATEVARAVQLLLGRGWAGRPLRPSDVALLAPTRTGLEAYERALERAGIPLASQAGKNYYRQQIIFDLLALTRTLADPRDTLALGAFLRGPLVGVTDAALLDATAALRSESRLGALDALHVGVDPESCRDPVLRLALTRLQRLRRRAALLPPAALLREAVAEFRVEAILIGRNPRFHARDRANLARFLNDAQAFARRGLHAYAQHHTSAWREGRAEREAPADVGRDAVALTTIHAAKGLEWAVVIPVNATAPRSAPHAPLLARDAPRIHARVLRFASSGYEALRAAEGGAANEERIRLWYVAATRACDLLLLPRSERAEAGHLPWRSEDLPTFPMDAAERFAR